MRCRSVRWKFCERPLVSQVIWSRRARRPYIVVPSEYASLARADGFRGESFKELHRVPIFLLKYVHLNMSIDTVKSAREQFGLIRFASVRGQTNRTCQRNRTHSFDSASMGDSHSWATRGLVTR